MTRAIKRFVAVAPIALVLIAAACGGSGSSSASVPAGNGSAASTSAATGAARVSAATSTLGRIVVDGSSARTLYLFEKDAKGASACNGACARYWPPLLSHGQPVAGPGATQSLLGTIQRADGSTQVTYAGHPLYTYIADTQPGQTSGEGSQLFGAGWDALSPVGQKIEADG